MSKANAVPLNIINRNDLTPICCHCDKGLTEVYSKTKGVGFIEGKNVLYFCPHCMKVLGFGQSRMI
ncbi:MAG: hypothetical protein QNJ40_13540 [Xanthomonadales bacterium]|nr:hypothetical protein [Xanthomonadales bacterium]